MKNNTEVLYDTSFFTEQDICLFKEGKLFCLYDKLGAHLCELKGTAGTYFALWAPNAQMVSVIGDFNNWDKGAHKLFPRWDHSGIWEGFIPGVAQGVIYKYFVVSKLNNFQSDRTDPVGFYCERPPKTSSIVWDLNYSWSDSAWLSKRREKNALNSPQSIYELHLGSWRRMAEDKDRYLTYRETANALVEYIKDMGFTHVELMPVMEHPFYGSWGYQTLGYFAPTNRYGTPQDFMYMVDLLHQNGIGVILDWVPSHFPSDGHGLVYFDGSHSYEHADPQKGFHPDWKSYIFNHGRNEVKEFLISSALFWFDHYHIDGIRVDAVASMLYLDYSRKAGEWSPNIHGGRDNIEAIDFIRLLNETVYKKFPDVQMVAEESTAWPCVSRPTYAGGLGFGMKWNMGWMHDTLEYFQLDPLFRKFHHNDLTFSMLYAFTENFVLALSHDEVVHGKGSLLNKMPKDEWQKFANLRALYSYMYAHPGKKLLFMGAELGQWSEWYHERSLDWHLLENPLNQGIQRLIKDLNGLYKKELALHHCDFEHAGFEWIHVGDWQNSILAFMRKAPEFPQEQILAVCNFTPVVHNGYRIGVPFNAFFREILNSDAGIYGGSGCSNGAGVQAEAIAHHGRDFSLSLNLPPLGVVYLKPEPIPKENLQVLDKNLKEKE